MAWMSAYSYEYTIVDGLKTILKQRKLRLGGRRAKLISRLIQYDLEHPFPFLKLPAEIRNMIYDIVVDFHSIEPWRTRFKPKSSDRNLAMIKRPDLFQVCRAIRSETSVLFFQHRKFQFLVENGSATLEALQGWLNGLALSSLNSIRFIQITFRQAFKLQWLLFVDYFVRKLSCETSITLNAMELRDKSKFFNINSTYRGLSVDRRPHLKAYAYGPLCEVLQYPWEGENLEAMTASASLVFRCRSEVPSPKQSASVRKKERRVVTQHSTESDESD